MAKTVLLRLSDDGKPIVNDSITSGILLLPSLPLPDNYKNGDPLFNLIFQLNAASIVSKESVLLTNLPKTGSAEFERSNFTEYPIEPHFHEDVLISIPIYKPGAFCFYLRYHDADGVLRETDQYYFNVPPNLTINEEYVAFNNINLQSVVSKWIGPLDKWNELFQDVSKKGYNMVHFTPLQERGESDSPYSIFDQLRLDPLLFENNEQGIDFIKEVLAKNDLLSITDVVWNHTANNSEWLKYHPESGYNQETAPHLTSAIELDDALLEFSSKLSSYDLPIEITNGDELNIIIEGVSEHVLNPLRLWEYYVFDKISTLSEIKKVYFDLGCQIPPIDVPPEVDRNDLKQLSSFVLKSCNTNSSVILRRRFSNKLDATKFLKILLHLVDVSENNFEAISSKANSILDEVNLNLYATYDSDVSSIKEQLKDRIRYLRLDENGPKLGPIDEKNPLTEPYFTKVQDLEGNEWSLANNGWIWGGNPLVDFASSASKAYLRREVIVWHDCVKLRYGRGIDDSPYLWNRMIEYTKMCAAIFGGFRIDNCHSTPLHVGETLLDAARSVNNNLYVVAELFSGSEEMDKIFVERLGINSLIREAMQAWLVSELSRLVHKHGGRPIGSLTWLPLDELAYPSCNEPQKNKYPECSSELEIPVILSNELPHALFMDCTHDNQMPAEKRTVEDTLPNAALVAFCSSAIGSVMGYDEMYPKLLDVVGEKRQYTYGTNGIGKVKLQLHAIRHSLALESKDSAKENEMYIHHEDQYINIQRYNSRTGKGWLLIARTKFSEDVPEQILSPVRLGGTHVKCESCYTLKKTGEYKYDNQYLTGVPVRVEELDQPKVFLDGNDSVIQVGKDFIPGSIALFSTFIPGVDLSLDKYVKDGAVEASKGLDLYDLNVILYRCEQEERDASNGADGTYTIPGVGPLVFAGLQGWVSVLKSVIWENKLGDPICDHLREGEWALDYVVDRLNKYLASSDPLKQFHDWLKDRITAIRVAPYFLRPHYFALVIGVAYEAARFRALRHFSKEIQNATNFVQSMALTSVQMVGRMNNTSLKAFEQVPCIAAGLPHFSNDYMRCWGRDVFISFRGLLIVTGRFEDAKNHILGFAQTLKHGLIPNLLDAGRNPRYNARDAAWFFIQAVKEYVIHAKDGASILDEKVKRRFPLDDRYIRYDDKEAFSYKSSIRDIIFEILARHAKGIKFREANAGPNLDSQMSDEGFNVEVYIDWSTGFVHGGSQYNCGTWMDKMGESEKAGSKGVPGTPRDGAAIELQGLLKSSLGFVRFLNSKGLFKYTEVSRSDGSKISFATWEKLIQDNFEKHFYIPLDSLDDKDYKIDPSLVNRRGIYKDLYKTGKPYEDYQLRPNFAIAMVVAPELFSISKAVSALSVADTAIRGKVGMKTLDPSDWNYRPYYNNGEDSTDFATSKGRNYHQGPEWVWCTGYFLRAFSLFHYLQTKQAKSESWSKIKTDLNERLQGNVSWIRESPWAGLTELTNKDGEFCYDSSPTQAWSTSCLLDLYYDIWNDDCYKDAVQSSAGCS
ncbi:uncharacterized protein PRCAT00000260001 [Priceomyces carsonii]|uniref:uncharacterized protein n=1 Tax=Priceomyces carsonii TaxID=28549 RepID=UPI002EDB18DD|nr:unnamed protein product [Priceomyces carsonii]